MPRRALRPSFVVTFALGATAIAGGCGGKAPGNGSTADGSIGDGSVGDGSSGDGDDVNGSIGDGGCPAGGPMQGVFCDLPSSVTCPDNSGCNWSCQQESWVIIGCFQNPPSPISEAGANVYDAAPDGYEGGHDVHDGAPDGEGQDGGHD